MRKNWRMKRSPVPFYQLNSWKHLTIEIAQLDAQLQRLPDGVAPPPLLVELVRLLRADLYRLVSREVGCRALKRPLPDNADRDLLSQNLDEARLGLARFREAHSASWSDREDQWLIGE